MIVLGIVNEGVSGASLIRDDKIVASAGEERFTRIKNDTSWPNRSINYVLESQKVSLDDVDYVAYGWHAGFNAEKHLLMLYDRVIEEAFYNPDALAVFRQRIAVEIERDAKIRKKFTDFIDQHNLRSKLVCFDHHECHALSAFCYSPFEKALVLTCDGRGDFQSLTVSVFDNDNYKVIYRAPTFDSLGFFYARITQMLGFRVNRHEGKVTGLAAYGDQSKYLPLMEKMISYKEGRVIGHTGAYYSPFSIDPIYSDELTNIIKDAKAADIAAAAQRHLENILINLTDYYLKKTELKYVCMAGGVFANVRLNQGILELPQVKNIFIQPHMSDGGLALGAAAGVVYSLKKTKIKWSSMYLGPEFNDSDVASFLNDAELIVKRDEDIVSTCIESLSANLVVGWFQGRMEEGPRALCHRSILYHCKDKTVNHWLNERMKRTEFMPFAPVTAIELASRCYKNWHPDHIASYYMTITYNCTEEMLKDCPAAIHVDGTARPQVISKEMNPLMYEVLMKWYDKTKGLALINTSFNMHEEPIVCTPADAIKGLKDNMIDILIIGSYTVRKNRDCKKKLFQEGAKNAGV